MLLRFKLSLDYTNLQSKSPPLISGLRYSVERRRLCSSRLERLVRENIQYLSAIQPDPYIAPAANRHVS